MIKGDVKLDLNLDFVRGSTANKAIRIAFNRAMRPVKAAVIQEAPGSTLKKSIRIKVKYYQKSKQWLGLSGPGSKLTYKESGDRKGTVTRGTNKGVARTKRPARYAHIVNWGSKYVGGVRFLEKAFSKAKPQFVREIAKTIRQEFRQARRGKGRYKKKR